MKYKEALKKSMEMLAQDKDVRFIGYNISYGSRVYGSLSNIPISRCLETPVAENLMIGLATGMSLEGYKPVLFFERHDFILNALDGIVNHLDKLEVMSHNQFTPRAIIRANIGAKGMLYPGLQHIQDFSEVLKKIVSFPVISLENSEDVLREYEKAKKFDKNIMFIEKRELYDLE